MFSLALGTTTPRFIRGVGCICWWSHAIVGPPARLCGAWNSWWVFWRSSAPLCRSERSITGSPWLNFCIGGGVYPHLIIHQFGKPEEMQGFGYGIFNMIFSSVDGFLRFTLSLSIFSSSFIIFCFLFSLFVPCSLFDLFLCCRVPPLYSFILYLQKQSW